MSAAGPKTEHLKLSITWPLSDALRRESPSVGRVDPLTQTSDLGAGIMLVGAASAISQLEVVSAARLVESLGQRHFDGLGVPNARA